MLYEDAGKRQSVLTAELLGAHGVLSIPTFFVGTRDLVEIRHCGPRLTLRTRWRWLRQKLDLGYRGGILPMRRA